MKTTVKHDETLAKSTILIALIYWATAKKATDSKYFQNNHFQHKKRFKI